MTAPAPHLANLSADHRRELESLLLKFDQSWDEKRLPAALRKLPSDSPLRRPALIEMIKVDLERRWKAGQKVRLDAYLKPFPELGTADDLPVDLIFAEYQVRRQFGTAAGLSDFAHRFPRQIDEVRRRVEETDRDIAPDASGASVPTLRPDQAKGETVRQAGGTSGPTALPEQFGRYRILKCIGRGGMGSVYLAHDPQLDRQVALKAPHFSAGDGPEVLERFTREARAAATIDHPNICPVYDVGVHDGIHYVTMAYVEGRPLSELVRDGKPLPPRPAAAVVRKLALALAEAHRHGVIHRDLKPSNVMVNRRKEPVIMDFGLARRVNKEDERLTKTGAVLGTPAYMPPEQVSGDVQAMGPACDIYSLGVMLYEMLTGRPPFQGQLAAVLGQILTKAPEPPSKLRPGLDLDLEAICLKAMAKKPKDRFASMDEMADALGRYLKGEAGPVKTRPAATAVSTAKGRAAATKKGDPLEGSEMTENLLARLVDRLEAQPSRTPQPPPHPPAHGAPWWIAPVAALVIVAGALAVVLVLINRTPTITVSPNINNTNNNTVAVQLAGLADRLSDATLIFILDSHIVTKEELSQPISLAVGDHKLVVKRGDAVIETRQFAVGGQDDKQTVPVPPARDGGTAVAVKDEKPGDKDKSKLPAKTKDPIVLEGHVGAVTGLVFSPNGETLASGSRDKTIVLWDVAQGKERKTLNDKEAVASLSFSPDGRTLASGRGGHDDVTILWDMQDYNKTMLKPTKESQGSVDSVAFSPNGKLLAVQNVLVDKVWDLASGKEIGTIEQGANGSGHMVFSKDGALLAVPDLNAKVRVWDTAARKEKVLEGHSGAVYAVSFSPNGKTLASGGNDRTVKLWDLASGEVTDNLKGYDQAVWGVQYTPDGKALVTGGGWRDPVFKVWDVSGAKATELPKARDLPAPWPWQTAPDNKTVALAYFDKTVNSRVVVLWDLYTGEERARALDKEGTTVMAFSANGRWLAWGREDGKVMLWEVGLKAPAAERPAPPPGEPSPAAKALLDGLTDPDSNDGRRQAAEGLKKLGDKTAVAPLEDRVADDLFNGEPSRSSPPLSSKCVAVEALKELAPDRVTPALVRATHSATEEVRVWACWQLGTLKDKLKTKEGTDTLIAALKDKAVAVRVEAAAELATGRHAAVPALADALFDRENAVRCEAARTLLALGDRSANRPDAVKQVIDGAVPALEKRVADDVFNDEPSRSSPPLSSKCVAVEALKELAPDRVTPALLGALAQEKNEDVRLWACWKLGQQDDKDSLDGLAAASKADKSPRVHEEALKAIAQRNK